MNPGTNFSIRFNAAVYGDKGLGKNTFVKTVMQKYLNTEQIEELLRGPRLRVEDKGDKSALSSDYCFTIKCPTNEVVVNIFTPTNDSDIMNKKKYIDSLCMFMNEQHLDWVNTNTNMLAEQDRLHKDNRIHCLFYFLSPQNIKEKDFEAIAALSKYTCVVPIISKSDTLTYAEREEYLLQAHKKFEEVKNKNGASICYDFGETNIVESVPCVESTPTVKCPVDAKTVVSSVVKSPTDTKSEVTKKSIPKYRNVSTPNEKDIDKSTLGAMDESFYLLQPEISTEFTFGSSQRVANEMVMTAQNDQLTSNALITKHVVTVNLQDKVFPSPLNKLPTDNNKKIFRLPNIFAIVCDSSLERNYSWGCVKVCDDATSDFCRLQKLVFECQHMKLMRDEVQKQTSLIYETNKSDKILVRFCFSLLFSLWMILLTLRMIPDTPKLKISTIYPNPVVDYQSYDAMETAYAVESEDDVCDDSNGVKAWLRNFVF